MEGHSQLQNLAERDQSRDFGRPSRTSLRRTAFRGRHEAETVAVRIDKSRNCFNNICDLSTMQSSDSGRKLNQAMVSTGRAVATTSKAVGGAFSQAKGVFSNWWSNLLVSPEPVQKALEAFPDNGMQIEESPNEQNIPKSINKNLSNGNIDKSSFKEGGPECSLPNNIHQPGEVHTV